MKWRITAFFLFIRFIAVAQGTISGQIVDSESKKALDFVTVSLKSADNPSFIRGDRTDEKGNFIIKKIPLGSYILQVSYLGYETKKIATRITQNNKRIKLGTINLDKSRSQLGTVLIEADAPTIDIQADKKVFNVDQNISSQGGTLQDALTNVPGVNVSADGAVSLRGKSNVTILIDGKQNALLADLATALQSIPADNIKSIEVITNPSAKYEAQGLGGIINIVLKESKRKKGLTGSVNVGAKYNWKANAGLNLNYRPSDRLSFFLNANGGTGRVWETNSYERFSYENANTFRSESIKWRDPNRLFTSFGVEYAIDKRNKLTWTNSFFRGRFGGNDSTDIFEEEDFTSLNERWFRNNVYTAWPSSNTSNLKYQRSYNNPKQKLNIELNLSSRNYIRESDYQTDIYDPQDNLINSFTQRNPIDGGNINGAFQIDYEHPIGENGKLEVGERTYAIKFQSQNEPTIQFLNQAEVEETILKNNFDYISQVHGLYTTYSTKYKDYSFQVGLRGEYFQYDGSVEQLASDFTTDYLSLFPSAFVSKKLDKTSDVSFNYSRRVNRPNFFALLPAVRVNNPLDTSIGNPGLRPEFINAFELSYNKTYKRTNTFLISAYYQLTNDIIQRFRRFNADGSTFSQTQNLASGTTFGLEITNQYFIRKGWDITLNANGFRNIINGSNIEEGQDFEGYGGFLKLVNNTKIGKLWNIQISGNYFAPKIIVQGIRKGYGFIDFAIKRSFMDKQLNLTFIASDILNTNKTITEYDLPTQFQRTIRNRQTQFIGFNLSYTFPKKGKKGSYGKYNKGGKKSKERDDNLKGDDDGGY